MTKENKIFVAALVVIGLAFGAAVAWGATNLNFNNSVTLEDGEYCLQQSHSLSGNTLEVSTSVTDGACVGGGETIVVGSGDATPTPTPTSEPVVVTEIPAHCPQDVTYNVVEVPVNASTVYGTSAADLIVTTSGYKVWARGGADCVETGSGSIVQGQGAGDYIKTGTGSQVNGGTGQDTCITGFGSSETSCELN